MSKEKKRAVFKAGMFLLENLTSGMYNEPLSIYREYIQNAVDSIDLLADQKQTNSLRVDIEIDPPNRSIKIYDNGIGVPKHLAEEVLGSFGSSSKTDMGLRGFRGIGRLGGIAFSDRAIFRTKGRGERSESIQEWDCGKLRRLLSQRRRTPLDLEELFNETTSFEHKKSKWPEKGFFEVTLLGVSSFRNQILDIQKVREYLSQVAPVPFDLREFQHGKTIDSFLREKLHHYGQYSINLNGIPIFKPYHKRIKITKGSSDEIQSVNFFEIAADGGPPVAYGWYGVRKDLLGSISKGEGCAGIRVRVGNILIGDAHLLDGCFRENRFNSYLIGEVQVDSPGLIPNSRRDDFTDNQVKTEFYNSVEKIVGLPFSKEIRLRSRVESDKALKSKEETALKTRSNEQVLVKRKGGGCIAGDSNCEILTQIRKVCRKCVKYPSVMKKCLDTKK